MIPDGELLSSYVEMGSEAAFTELVQRHIHVVYHSALRRVGGNTHAADDVTQRVFTALGIAYCKAHADELESYPPFFTPQPSKR